MSNKWEPMRSSADNDTLWDTVSDLDHELDVPRLKEEDGKDVLDRSTVAHIYAAAINMGLPPIHAEAVSSFDVHTNMSPEDWDAIRTQAANITDPWGWLSANTRGNAPERLKAVLSRYEVSGTAGTEPADADLDAPATPPDWVVAGIAARERRTLLSAAHSGSKTSLIAGVIKAAVTGEDFLGEPVNAERILIISGEETYAQLGSEKLRPVGIRNEHKPQFKVYERGTFPRPGTPEGNAWFIAAVEEFKPDLVVLDTTGTVLAVNPLDNEAVTELYERTLNPVCDRVGAALLFTHHHRKGGASGNMREAALGAVAWENQADFVVTIRCVKPYAETPLDGGHVQTNSTFVMRWPKGRGGLVDAPFPYEIHGEKDAPAPKGATLSLELRLPTAELTDAEQIAAVVEGETPRKAIADALPWGGDGTGTKFRDALKAAEDEQLIFKVAKGIYSDTPAPG